MFEEIDDIKTQLAVPREICILTHRNPDGDAIGSSLGLKYYLEKSGHFAQVIFPSEYPAMFHFLPGIKETIVCDLAAEDARKCIAKADVIFCLDFNALDRIDPMGLDVMEAQGFKVLIDHHIDPEPFADVIISDRSASSTSELVYLFLEALGEASKVDEQIAEALFTGILTDTGSFKFSTSPRLFQVASALKERGVNDYMLQIRLFSSLTEKQLRLLGHCLANRMDVFPAWRTGIIYLNKEDYSNFNILRGDTEGIVNYILMMRHIKIAMFITEQGQYIKLSFRSKGNVNVQQLARNYFNGGGHKNASGGYTKSTLEETLAQIKEILPEYLTQKGYLKAWRD